jgi:hypothetical protein
MLRLFITLLVSSPSLLLFSQEPGSQSYWQKVNSDTSLKKVEFNGPSQADYDRKVTNDALSEIMQGVTVASALAASTSTVLGTGTQYGQVMQNFFNNKTKIFQNLDEKSRWFKAFKQGQDALNVYSQTKNMVGVMGATIGNLRDMTNLAMRDARTKTNYTEQIMRDANAYLNWDNELAGFSGRPTTYTPLFNFLDMYQFETQQFRDRNGNFSLLSRALSAGSDQALMSQMRNFNAYVYRIQQNNALINDLDIRKNLEMAIVYERKARWLNLQINLELFGRQAVNIKSAFSNIGMGPKSNAPEKTATDNAPIDNLAAGDVRMATSGGRALHSDAELQEMIDGMQRYQSLAQECRWKAMGRMQDLARAQMTPENMDLIKIKRRLMTLERLRNQVGNGNKYDVTKGFGEKNAETQWQPKF